MVRRRAKYKWRYRKYHFQEILKRQAFEKSMLQNVILQNSLLREFLIGSSELREILIGSSDPRVAQLPRDQTCFGPEGDTTISPSLKEEVVSGQAPWTKSTMKVPRAISEEEEELRYAVAFDKKPMEELTAFLARKEGADQPCSE